MNKNPTSRLICLPYKAPIEQPSLFQEITNRCRESVIHISDLQNPLLCPGSPQNSFILVFYHCFHDLPQRFLATLGLQLGLQWGSNGAPMRLQWGEMGKNNLSDLLFFLALLIICYGIFGVLSIPEWPINDSWWIPLFFWWFLELPKCSPNLDLDTSLFK